MIPQTETRKLAAVMFADIEGYTSLFQRNESAAMRQVEDHRKDLQDITTKHNGQIIQFYGDGSVTIYDSVIDAIESAIEFQQASAINRIPVRIGIHMGDLVYKDKDIFGDVVNVTSRIQTAGIPGSVLVSKKVVDELANHPEIHTTRLGFYTLKNVKERIELFALTNAGLTVPAKLAQDSAERTLRFRYLLFGSVALILVITLGYAILFGSGKNKLSDGSIFVLPFKDHTSNPQFDSLGYTAASYITKILNEATDAEALSFESTLLYFSTDLASINDNPSRARQAGTTYVLLGNYDLEGPNNDSLRFWASIQNCRTNEKYPLSIPDVKCAASNDWDCIEKMANILAGYWKGRDDMLFRPTNNKAYTAYTKAQSMWADPQKADKAKEFLLQAIRFDPKFMDAWLLLIQGFNNDDSYEDESDTIEFVKAQFPEMTPREQDILGYYEADLKGQNVEAFQYLLKEYYLKPKDLFVNSTAMVMAVEFLNDPLTALEFHKQIDVDNLNLNSCEYCRTRVNMALQAFMDIADRKNAAKMAEKLRKHADKMEQITRLINYYISIQDTASISSLIRKSDTPDAPEDIQQYYYMLAAQYALLYGDPALMDFYADKSLRLNGNGINWKAARCHYLKGNLTSAESMCLENLKAYPDDSWFLADLGLIYAKRGDSKKVNEIIRKLEAVKREYDFGKTPYLQGKLKATLGETEAAIQYLSTALEEGVKFQAGTTFQHDPDLIVLGSNPEYLKLLARNRQHLMPK